MQRERDAQQLARSLEQIFRLIAEDLAAKLLGSVTKAEPDRKLSDRARAIITLQTSQMFGRSAQRALQGTGLEGRARNAGQTTVARDFSQRLTELADVLRRTADSKSEAAVARVLERREGASRRELAAALTEEIGGTFNRDRALTWARTEAAVADNSGAAAAYEAAGVQRIEWIAFKAPVWPRRHDLLDGEVRNLGDFFDMPRSSARLRWPHDPLGPVGEVVNCRCSHRPVIRRSRSP